jgi:hypothetical protein
MFSRESLWEETGTSNKRNVRRDVQKQLQARFLALTSMNKEAAIFPLLAA